MNLNGILLKQYPTANSGALKRQAQQIQNLAMPMMADVAMAIRADRRKKGNEGLFNNDVNEQQNAMARQFGIDKKTLFG